MEQKIEGAVCADVQGLAGGRTCREATLASVAATGDRGSTYLQVIEVHQLHACRLLWHIRYISI
jgi:hypothetical protein